MARSAITSYRWLASLNVSQKYELQWGIPDGSKTAVRDFNAHENSVKMMCTGHDNKNIWGFSENIRGFSPLAYP